MARLYYSNAELQIELQRFFNDKVVVRRKEMKVAKRMVRAIVDIVEEELRSEEVEGRLGLEIGPPIFTGSVWEGLKEGLADEFDVIFPIILDGTVWRVERLQDLDPGYIPYKCYLHWPQQNASHYQNIIRKYGNVGASIELSPDKIISKVKKEIEIALEESSSSSGNIEYSFPKTKSGPSIILHLNYSPDRLPHPRELSDPSEFEAYVKYSKPSAVSVDLVPCLMLKSGDSEILLVGKGREGYYRDVWRRSFSLQEKALLRDINKEGGCHKKVLRILKAIRRKAPYSETLNYCSYIFKNAILNIYDKGNWGEDNLANQFKAVLHYLEHCFRRQNLPRYFEPRRNLLAKEDERMMENSCSTLHKINTDNHYILLLS